MIFNNNNNPIVHGKNLCQELEKFLTKHKADFERPLIPDLSYLDSRAQNINGIDIDSVTYAEDNKYQLDYSYDWSIYRGCSDMNTEGKEYDAETFTVDQNGYIKFDRLHIEERSTSEEF